jgi:hypothetical protein
MNCQHTPYLRSDEYCDKCCSECGEEFENCGCYYVPNLTPKPEQLTFRFIGHINEGEELK